jgi:CheY-like chemotaxis protein
MIQAELLRNQKLESLGVLAGGIAHDFNNILTAIMGNISFAKLDTDTSFSSYASLERAEKACQRAAELAKQLLVFAKGGQPIKKVISLDHLVKDIVALTLSGTNVQGIIDFPESLYAVEADEGQISQSLHNIIINAVQAMPGGGKLVVHGENITVHNSAQLGLPTGSYILISFKDEGCGISEVDQKKIFDPYFTTKAEGTGLGLASAYSCIAKHGGRIVVNSSVGKGSTFTIILPSMGTKVSQPAIVEEAALGDHSDCSILVMDDDEMIRDLATITLSRFGYKVTTCSDGEKAIQLYASAKTKGIPFALVIMDLTIPGGMGGKEAAQKILILDPEARLIVSSGYSDDPVMANFAEFGFCAAIEKPYKVKDIAAVLASAR